MATKIRDLSDAQHHAMINPRVPRAEPTTPWVAADVSSATRRALQKKGLCDQDGQLTPAGITLHEDAAVLAGVPTWTDRVAERKAEEAEYARKQIVRDERVREAAEVFRGMAVPPTGWSSSISKQEDVDLADVIVDALAENRSTTVTLRLEHIEAFAQRALEYLGKSDLGWDNEMGRLDAARNRRLAGRLGL